MAVPLNKVLLVYSAVLTTALAGGAVSKAISAPDKASFGEIDVQRINLREKDGTLRMVLASKSAFPGIIWRGKDYPHPSRNNAAGMLFFNDEGTENGGLIFGGSKTDKVRSFGHLSFDQYENDQVVSLEQSEEDGHRAAGLSIGDRPGESMDIPAFDRIMKMPDGPAKTEAMKGLEKAGFGGHSRLFVGKEEGVSMLTLKDVDGHARLRLSVKPTGEAAIEFLDSAGKAVRTVTPKD
jgi:hypothetical protein